MTRAVAHDIVSSSTTLDWIDLKHLHSLTGQSVNDFDQVIVKELVDNAIDAAENAGKAPTVAVNFADTGDNWTIKISDNGPGLTAEQIVKLCDFTTRASSKDWRRATTRGQQGNAFKTVIGIPVAFQRQQRPQERTYQALEVASLGRAYDAVIDVSKGVPVPELREKPAPGAVASDLAQTAPGNVEFSPTTTITVNIPHLEAEKINRLLSDYVAVNPHLTLIVNGVSVPALNPAWKPSPKSAIDWYTDADFERLCNAGRQLNWTVSTLIGSLAGFTAKDTIAAVMETAGVPPRTRMQETGAEQQERLLVALREQTEAYDASTLRRVKGERLLSGGKYAHVEGEWNVDGATVPFVVEAALLETNTTAGVTTAINYAPTYSTPFPSATFDHYDGRHSFEGFGLDGYLASFYIDPHAPVRVALHIICPRLDFRDRGKSAIDATPELRGAVAEVVWKVAREFYKRELKHRNQEKRLNRQAIRQIMPTTRDPHLTEVMDKVIPLAYEQAAGAYGFAFARQIFYKARPLFQKFTSKELKSGYFTQVLLPSFVNANPELTKDWNIFRDARGHLWEPHGGEMIPLGTDGVRSYLQGRQKTTSLIDHGRSFGPYRFKTSGPLNRYGTILFIEKEGFVALLEESGLLREFDVALMSTKGMSTGAARELLEGLQDNVKILALHDFDVAGMSIAATLRRDTASFKLARPPEIIDIGLRLDDVEKHDLPDEEQPQKYDVTDRLRAAGATDEEVDFLASGRRVELNAFGNDEFVEWVRGKLEEHAEKVVPGDDVLAAAFEQAQRHAERRRLLAAVEAQVAKLDVASTPTDLRQQIADVLDDDPQLSWDAAVALIVDGAA